MAAKPNFTSVTLADDTLRVMGSSDISEGNDLLDIRVVVAQGPAAEGEQPRVASGPVAELSEAWQADLDVEGKGFTRDAAVVFGVESRSTNSATTTWTQPLDIE
jgi:hypothetical protein